MKLINIGNSTWNGYWFICKAILVISDIICIPRGFGCLEKFRMRNPVKWRLKRNKQDLFNCIFGKSRIWEVMFFGIGRSYFNLKIWIHSRNNFWQWVVLVINFSRKMKTWIDNFESDFPKKLFIFLVSDVEVELSQSHLSMG